MRVATERAKDARETYIPHLMSQQAGLASYPAKCAAGNATYRNQEARIVCFQQHAIPMLPNRGAGRAT